MASIYIHIPFCKQACHYCNFYFSTSQKRKGVLVQSIARELELRGEELANQQIETIYFGGGTPSLLSIAEMQELFSKIYKHYTVSEAPEVTLEANPDDLSARKLLECSKTPINRLSIGIQSFFEDDLTRMHRSHDALASKRCLEDAATYFDNISIDLIYGLPGMDIGKWDENLQIAFGFGIAHIAAYALTVEPKTALHTLIKKGHHPPVEAALALKHFRHLVRETERQGFVHYEVSNFGKPNCYSKHNIGYWQGDHYLGVGPSAHSFDGQRRCWNVSNNTIYAAAIGRCKLPYTSEVLSVRDRYNEYVMIGLRTLWGLSLCVVERAFGSGYQQHLLACSAKFIAQGLLAFESCPQKLPGATRNFYEQNSCDVGFIRTTSKGMFLVDGIASALFAV